jgi:hypothetical protein
MPVSDIHSSQVRIRRQSVTARTRHKLNELFGNRAYSKTALASYCRKPPSWLSNFLHPSPTRTERPSFHMDELDDIAAYFRISIGELLGAAKIGELSGDEQRLLFAFRVVPVPVQAHFLALLEQASLVPRSSAPHALLTPTEQGINVPPAKLSGSNAPPVQADPSAELTQLREELTQLRSFLANVAAEILTAGAGEIPNRSAASLGAEKAQNGNMAD